MIADTGTNAPNCVPSGMYCLNIWAAKNPTRASPNAANNLEAVGIQRTGLCMVICTTSQLPKWNAPAQDVRYRFHMFRNR